MAVAAFATAVRGAGIVFSLNAASFVAVIAVPLVVMMVVLIALEKGRLQIENAIEVEGVAAQNRIERDLGAFSLVQLGIRVDAPNARFDIA